MSRKVVQMRQGPVPSMSSQIRPRLVGRVGSKGRVVFRTADGRATSGGATITKVLLAERGKALLLGNGVDVCADDKGHKIEEWYPGVLGQELLGEREADGRGDPANTHHLPETDPHRRPNLVERSGTSDQGHGNKIHGVLDWGNLYILISTGIRN